jgi:uncharacterized peroxidase-related enzyme
VTSRDAAFPGINAESLADASGDRVDAFALLTSGIGSVRVIGTGRVSKHLRETITMARIGWVEEADAVGETAELYAAWRQANPTRDRIPDILKCFSQRPDVLKHMLAFSYELHFRDGALTWGVKELLATYVSAVNQCEYCASSHACFLEYKDTRTAVVAALRRGDLDSAPVTDAERVLLAFAGRLTKASHTVTDADVAGLREAGWTEPQIAEAVYVVAMFNLFNRVANAFGLPPVDYRQILAQPDFGGEFRNPVA